jgi:predicted  nucleic acid-binding Zn-ribbon protein
MEWLPTWEQLGGILVLVIAISTVINMFCSASSKKKKNQEDLSMGILSMQNNIARILESIAKIEGKMDYSSTQIIELERKHALTEQKLEAAWSAIEKVETNCKEIQRAKRKDLIG